MLTTPPVSRPPPEAQVSDATGRVDVAAEFQAALDDAWASFAALNFTLANSGSDWSSPDLGGMVLDLCGGSYLLSSPIRFPAASGGNLHMVNGALHADPAAFPLGEYVLHIDALRTANKQERYRFVVLDALEIDAARRGAGCLRVEQSEETLVHRLLCVGFTDRGLWSVGVGNELFVQRSWFHELRDYAQCHNDSAKTGTGIWLDNNDHQIDGVVIYCARQGIVVNGSATLVRAAHIYTESSLPAEEAACIRVLPGAATVRLEALYMDGCPVVAEAPKLLHVSGGMWLLGRGTAASQGGIVLSPGADGAPLPALQITGNQVSGRGFNGSFVRLNETAGIMEFDHSQAFATVVVDNAMDTWTIQKYGTTTPATRFTKTAVFAGNASTFVVPFSASELLLCGAAHVTYSLVPHDPEADAFVPHALVKVQPPLLSLPAVAGKRAPRASEACPPGSPRLLVTIATQRPVAGVTIMVRVEQTRPVSAAASPA